MATQKQVVSISTRLRQFALAIGLEAQDIPTLEYYEDITYDDGSVSKPNDSDPLNESDVKAARMRSMIAVSDAMIARYVGVADRDNGIAGIRIGHDTDEEGNPIPALPIPAEIWDEAVALIGIQMYYSRRPSYTITNSWDEGSGKQPATRQVVDENPPYNPIGLPSGILRRSGAMAILAPYRIHRIGI